VPSTDRITPGRRLTALYLAVQGLSGAIWWLALLLDANFRSEFQPAGYPPDFINTCMLADVALFVGASLLTAWRVGINHRWWPRALWLTTGAVVYAWLHTLGIAGTAQGFGHAAAMMTAPALCMLAIAFTMRRDAPEYPRVRFRVAPENARHLLQTMGQSAFFWTLFLGVVPAIILAVERGIGATRFGGDVAIVTGIALFILGSAAGIWSGATIATLGRGTPLPTACPARLVVLGPYSYVRNPMAVAGLTQGIGVGIATGSVGIVLYVFLGGIFWQLCVRPPEEEDLTNRFGDAYLQYCQQVDCWIPRSEPYKPPSA